MWLTDAYSNRDAFLSVRLRMALLRRLDAIAQDLHRTRSSVVEQALEEWVQRHPCPRPGDIRATIKSSEEPAP